MRGETPPQANSRPNIETFPEDKTRRLGIYRVLYKTAIGANQIVLDVSGLTPSLGRADRAGVGLVCRNRLREGKADVERIGIYALAPTR
jgi:hypothetical protein